MTKKELLARLEGLNDETVIEVSVPQPKGDVVWYSIKDVETGDSNAAHILIYVNEDPVMF